MISIFINPGKQCEICYTIDTIGILIVAQLPRKFSVVLKLDLVMIIMIFLTVLSSSSLSFSLVMALEPISMSVDSSSDLHHPVIPRYHSSIMFGPRSDDWAERSEWDNWSVRCDRDVECWHTSQGQASPSVSGGRRMVSGTMEGRHHVIIHHGHGHHQAHHQLSRSHGGSPC